MYAFNILKIRQFVLSPTVDFKARARPNDTENHRFQGIYALTQEKMYITRFILTIHFDLSKLYHEIRRY